jgi:hypothetical protein
LRNSFPHSGEAFARITQSTVIVENDTPEACFAQLIGEFAEAFTPLSTRAINGKIALSPNDAASIRVCCRNQL